MSYVRFVSRIALLTFVAGCGGSPQDEKISSVKYQGERFEIIKPATNYDYTDDRTFIKQEDAERAEQLIRAAPVGEHYANQFDLLAAIEAEVQFPGYPRSVREFRSTDPKDTSHILLLALEIPWRDKDRFLAFRSKPEDGSYDRVDDFVLEPKAAAKASADSDAPPPERPVVASVRFQGKQLRYLDPLGKVLREKTIP